MASEALNSYIEKRYDRWLDYSTYHCGLAGMDGEAVDVLNEVLCMLLQKDQEVIARLMEAKQGQYTELDFYILQMIKLNITSDTSPYRHKYKTVPVDDNVDYRRLNVIDEPDETADRSEYICDRFREVRDIVTSLGLSERAQQIFTWKFFAGESFADWPGSESKKELYDVYKRIFRIVLDKKHGRLLF